MVPRRCLPLFAILALLVSAAAVRTQAASIMVNEYKNTNASVAAGTKMTSDEYFEFILTQDMTVAQLGVLTFGDASAATSTLQGVFHFDTATLTSALTPSGLSAFKAGTILVVKGNGLGAQNLTYDPFGNPTSDDAWSLELVAGQGARDHPETVINGDIAIAGGGDVIWISSDNPPVNNTDTSSFISAIGHDNSPGVIANAVISKFGAGSILPSTITAPKSVFNTASTVVSLSSSNTGSMSSANGGANTLWINGMRTASLAPEPGRALLLLAGMQAMVMRRRRSSEKSSPL